MNRLLIQNFLGPETFLHCATLQRTSADRQGVDIHSHDFPELLIIEDGCAIHQINGRCLELHKGDLIFIRADDEHAIKIKQDASVRYSNIAFRLEHLVEFQLRLFKDAPNFWGGEDPLPLCLTLTPNQLSDMSLATQKLIRSDKTRLYMEWFLCELFRVIETSLTPPSPLPIWLQQALHEAQNPQHFCQGASVLAKLSHRSMEHVSREIRKHLNTTPSAIINELRMRYATHQLIQTNLDIINISMDCGIQSLSQFYSLFKEHHLVTPRQYRKQYKMIN
jgi:AraC family transcriptional regulator, dual regulator of chb operon